MDKHFCQAIVENDVYLMALNIYFDLELSNTCVSFLCVF